MKTLLSFTALGFSPVGNKSPFLNALTELNVVLDFPLNPEDSGDMDHLQVPTEHTDAHQPSQKDGEIRKVSPDNREGVGLASPGSWARALYLPSTAGSFTPTLNRPPQLLLGCSGGHGE